jgi:hypothetical protein
MKMRQDIAEEYFLACQHESWMIDALDEFLPIDIMEERNHPSFAGYAYAALEEQFDNGGLRPIEDLWQLYKSPDLALAVALVAKHQVTLECLIDNLYLKGTS